MDTSQSNSSQLSQSLIDQIMQQSQEPNQESVQDELPLETPRDSDSESYQQSNHTTLPKKRSRLSDEGVNVDIQLSHLNDLYSQSQNTLSVGYNETNGCESSSQQVFQDFPLMTVLNRKDKKVLLPPDDNPFLSIDRRPINKVKAMDIMSDDLGRYTTDFYTEKTLGHGISSNVLLARKRLDGVLYAIKKLERTPMNTAADYKKVMKEVYAIAALQGCPQILQYFNCWIEELENIPVLYIQTEYCVFGDLEKKFLKSANSIEYSLLELVIWVVLRDIGSALAYMHQRDMAHLDIRPANIFLTTNKYIIEKSSTTCSNSIPTLLEIVQMIIENECILKLGDFGKVCSINHDFERSWGKHEEGENRYIAPELMHSETTIDLRCADIFSLGTLAFKYG